MATSAEGVDVRRANERFHTKIDWLDSWHSFSFGGHHDPSNTHHGLLIVHNDDTVAPGQGFLPHAHRDMEIVSWVLQGRLEHDDTLGNRDVISPGLAQRMSAGTGIRHSEFNASSDEPLHFVQMWVPPDTNGIAPGYEQVDVSERLSSGDLFAIASGQGHDGAVRIHQQGAVLWGARLDIDSTVDLPDDPHVHLFVARGAVTLDGSIPLARGDAARLTEAGERPVTAHEPSTELLIWATS
jgi:redox-sensitive bicupin YhaK (pirin superfamily)